MKFHVLTLFPELIDSVCRESILGRAAEDGLVDVRCVNIRDFSHDKHLHVDDAPFGGGAGMVMQAEPIDEAFRSLSLSSPNPHVIYLSPKGRTLCQSVVEELAKEDELVLLCGHYEGVDQRILDEIVTDEISIGDYVLTGGELGACVLIDAVSRYVPGVLGNESSTDDESFAGKFLEYPQYTRPRVFHGAEVPEVLLNGNHEEIRKWRLKESMRITLKNRPDLIDPENMTAEEAKIFASLT